jgi:3-oxoacyl-[acyl-carrier protein] reductase
MAGELDPEGKKTLAVACDVSDGQNVADAFAAVTDAFGRIDVLVNNAGFTRDAMFHKMTFEQFTQVMDVHVTGMFLCSRQVVEGMRARQWGRIISMASTSAFGNIGQANYAAAKSAIIGFTRTLAFELARYRVTANCIAPGFINTDIIKTVPEKVMQDILRTIPMGRVGDPEDVAALTSFLASEDAGYITGECIRCSGGK